MPPPRQDTDIARVCGVLENLGLVWNELVNLYRHPVLDTGSQGLSKGNDIAIADRATLVRNDEKNLVPQYLSALVPSKKAAFTLAEVLITLAIIGVVTALTIPNLIQNYRKTIVETRLSHFYSAMNQAIKLSELENGDTKYWETLPTGRDQTAYEKKEKWFNKYILPYFGEVKEVNLGGQERWYHIYFTDGSLLSIEPWTGHAFWEYYPLGYKLPDRYGIEIFCFTFNPNSAKKFEPFVKDWNGTVDDLKFNSIRGCYTGSHYYCSALVQANGWRIPDDYPFKF